MLSGCVPEKGRRPLPSPTLSGTFQAQEPLPGEGGAMPAAGSPEPPHTRGPSCAQARDAVSSSVPRPRARQSHAHTHAHSLIVCPISFGEQSQKQRKPTATKSDTDSPSYHHPVPRGHMTGQPHSLSLSLSPTRTGQSELAQAHTSPYAHSFLTAMTPMQREAPGEAHGAGGEGEGGSHRPPVSD